MTQKRAPSLTEAQAPIIILGWFSGWMWRKSGNEKWRARIHVLHRASKRTVVIVVVVVINHNCCDGDGVSDAESGGKFVRMRRWITGLKTDYPRECGLPTVDVGRCLHIPTGGSCTTTIRISAEVTWNWNDRLYFNLFYFRSIVSCSSRRSVRGKIG